MRPIRLTVPGVVYHLIARFIDQEWFLDTEGARERYLALLGRSLRESDWRCFAYALMSSHVHLEVVAGREPVGEWLRRVHSPFANWMNIQRDRIGGVFMRAQEDIALTPDKEAGVLAYIHNNPVRAGVVRRASQSDWTSHRAYLGRDPAPSWLHVDEGFARTGSASAADLDRWVNRTPGESGRPEPLAPRVLNRRGAVVIATPSPTVFPLVARPYAHIRPDPRTVIGAVAELIGVAVDVLCSHQRIEHAVNGRALVVHCARMLGLTYAEIGAALGITGEGARRRARHELTASARRSRDLVCERIRLQSRPDPNAVFQFGHR